MNLQIDRPDADKLTKDANGVLSFVTAIVITDDQTYAMAADELKDVKAKYKALEDKRKAITQPIDTAKKEVMDLFRAPLATLEQAESALKRAMLDYTTEQRRIAAEAQKKLDEAAAAERKKLAEQAEQAAASGNEALAETLAATSQVLVAPVIQTEPAKQSGISTRTNWKAEVVSKAELVAHVAANPDLLELLDINQKALDAMARALKANLKLPGVKPVAVETLAARA